MWLKALLCVLVVVFCTALGYFAADGYRRRKAFYTQFYHFNEKYLNELEYARRPFGQFSDGQALSGDFQVCVEAYKRTHTAASPAWLKAEEKAECEEYFAMLGTGDAFSQRNFFTARRSRLEEQMRSAEKEASERGKLYLKLGLLFGLAFVILIV